MWRSGILDYIEYFPDKKKYSAKNKSQTTKSQNMKYNSLSVNYLGICGNIPKIPGEQHAMYEKLK